MKYYLSSFQMGDHTDYLQQLVPKGSNVALSANALDNMAPETRTRIYDRELKSLTNLGYKVSELDLRDHFDSAKFSPSTLNGYSMIWFTGGNAFVLNLAIRLSGFTDPLLNLLTNEKIVYGGYSAGAVVAGKSLEGINLVDRVDDFPKEYPSNEIIWEGLGLVDYTVVPHYKSEHPESPLIEKVVELLKKKKIAYRAIRDGEVIF